MCLVSSLRNLSLALSPRDFLLDFSKSGMVLCFTFNLVIHFKLMCVLDVWLRLILILFAYWCPLTPESFRWKGYLYSIELLLNFFQKLVGLISEICFWVLYFVPLIFVSIPPPILHSLNYYNSLISLEIGENRFFPIYLFILKLF